MNGGKMGGVSRRERLELTAAALVPGVLALVGPLAGAAGRLGWAAPFLALPLGLWLCRCWAALGTPDLGRGLERAFGRWPGRALEWGYFLWGLLLLAMSARRYVDRLSVTFREMPRWMLLTAAFGLCLWLSRSGGEAFARSGRLFFLFLMVTLGGALLLALPGVGWRYLWPPEARDWRGIPAGGLWCLELAGYGVYALCLSLREEGKTKGWPWVLLGCCSLAAVLFVTVGAFGPVLTAELEEPFLSLLEGVEVPGAFRRGEAVLAAVLIFGDIVLFGLLTHGCRSLWGRLMPEQARGGAVLFVAGAFLFSEMEWTGTGEHTMLLWGNLMAGILIPGLAFFTKGGRKGLEEIATFCGEEQDRHTDVGAKKKIEKS